MAKKDNDVLDALAKKGKRRAKTELKRLHPATKALTVLCLLVGIALGAVVCTAMSKKDHFTLKGQTQLSLEAGTPFVYVEEGFEAKGFGMDCSAKVKVQASRGITMDENGNFIIPAEEGIYTLTYTVDHIKYSGKLGGEQLQRIRVFTVNASEEDGRNG